MAELPEDGFGSVIPFAAASARTAAVVESASGVGVEPGFIFASTCSSFAMGRPSS